MKDGGNGQGILFKEGGKMHKRLKKIGLGLVAVGISMVLLLTGAIPLCEAKPNQKVVRMGLRACLSGPGASTTLYAHYGQFDTVKYINEQGGIDGIKLEWLWEDCRAQAPKSISAHRRFKEAGVVIESDCISSGVDITLSAQVRDEIPLLYMAELYSPLITKPQWVCAYAPTHSTELASFMKWVKDNWTEERPPRVGLLFCDFSAGWDAFEGRKATPELGVEFVGHEVIPFLLVIDVSTELLRLAVKKPDWIYVVSYAAPLVVVIKDAARLEFQEKGIKLITVAAGVDEIVMRTAGKDAEGWHRISFQPSVTETELPGLKTAFEIAKKYRGLEPEEVPGHYANALALTQFMVEAIRLAIEEIGFENLTGRAVRDAMFSIKDFETGIFPPMSPTEGKPFLASTYAIYQVQQGRLMRYSERFEPYYMYSFG